MILTTDLDNTLIYSYKHDIGNEKRCAEIYNGREISFITGKTFELLSAVKERHLIVPVTTRTEEQYRRIDLGAGGFEYALVCNGGVLLKNGSEDKSWYEQSMKLTESSLPEIKKAAAILGEDENVCFEIRCIRELLVFTKSREPEITAGILRQQLDSSLADVFTNGVKVYAVPKMLDKGTAVERLRDYLGEKEIFAAGDSEFDIPMIKTADHAVCPRGLVPAGENIIFCGDNELLSERMLEEALSL